MPLLTLLILLVASAELGFDFRVSFLARSSQENPRKKTKSLTKTGDEYVPKGRTGGDKGGKVEPFAYWPLDRKMLNRRTAKQRDARRSLSGIVRSTKVHVRPWKS